KLERTLALIKPDAYNSHKGDILTRIQEAGFSIVKEKEVQMSNVEAKEFYQEHEGKAFYNELVQWMSSAPIYALVLEREDAIRNWRSLAGPTDATKARESAPTSIRALFGTDGSKNAVHGSDSPQSAQREIKVVF
ncbi:nucleoside-diphosphate kinase, partial [Phlyctochytrium arcticum]